MVRHFNMGRCQEETYLHTDLLAAILALLFMLDNALVMAEVNICLDYSIQRDSYAEELENFVQEGS